MNNTRIAIVIILIGIVITVLWYLQRFKIPRVIARFIVAPLSVLFIILSVICNSVVKKEAVNKVYQDTKDIPFRDVGLVLGVSKVKAPLFFNNRIEAATELYRSGKIKKLIVSGDANDHYDEANDMKDALMANGIPDSVILMDRSGHRTLASIQRCKEEYHLNRITIVSQEYHDIRAIYLSSKLGLDAIGFSARLPKRTPPREYVSRLVAVFEMYF